MQRNWTTPPSLLGLLNQTDSHRGQKHDVLPSSPETTDRSESNEFHLQAKSIP